MARWGLTIRRVSVLAACGLCAAGAPAVAAGRGSAARVLASASAPVVPAYVPFALLLVLEGAAVLASLLVVARRRLDLSASLHLCSRCAALHERTEAFARVADAAAVGALAFLVALPFVADGYESGFAFANTALAAAAVTGVIAVAAEADFLVRAAAARVWPRFTWSAEPARIVGGGARWLGVVVAVYLFQPDVGIDALFDGVGKRLAVDLAATWTIWVAAAILVVAALVALAARWLIPLVRGSLPATLAARREPHGASP